MILQVTQCIFDLFTAKFRVPYGTSGRIQAEQMWKMYEYQDTWKRLLYAQRYGSTSQLSIYYSASSLSAD